MDDKRRIYYELTGAGRAALEAELQRYRNVVAVAKARLAKGSVAHAFDAGRYLRHVYRQRPHGEIKNPDSDLHNGQAQTRQDNPPMGAPDDARSRHQPDQIADNEHQPR